LSGGITSQSLKEAEKAMEIDRHSYLLGQPEMRVIENSLDAPRSKISQLLDDP
jgi:hypothetical protein